jgi:hypothetical protein
MLKGELFILTVPFSFSVKWKYKGAYEYHIGPMTEDFYKTFQFCNSDHAISTVYHFNSMMFLEFLSSDFIYQQKTALHQECLQIFLYVFLFLF